MEALKPLDLGFDAPDAREKVIELAGYANVPDCCAYVISNGLATLTELTTTLSVEGMFLLVEIARVDNHNAALIRKASDVG